ncbi:MAG: GAF domain-containing protein [Thermoanaerobaculia bacterium]
MSDQPWWTATPAEREEIAGEIVRHLRDLLQPGVIEEGAWREALMEGVSRLGFVGYAIWVPQQDGKLRSRLFKATVEMEVFEQQTADLTFAAGKGMPGRTFQRAAPQWIPNVIKDDNFPRLRGAIRDLVRALVAFPVMYEGRVCAVIEMYSRSVLEPDPETTQLLAQLGTTLGERYPEMQRLLAGE